MQTKKETKPLDIKVDVKSAIPIYEQIKQGVKLAIVSGYLEPGDQLVPIRELAAKLRVNANTIVKVYYQLDVEGYIYSLQGTGYFVREDLPDKQKKKKELIETVIDEFISKAIQLDYSVQDMIRLLEKRTKAKGRKSK